MSSPGITISLAPNRLVSDAAFDDQVFATREALKTFKIISAFNATGPARAALEELVDTTVCSPHFII
jgi:hypothetical protein